jgi:uncharacterized protein YktA (UPF0223 family)
MNVYNAGVILGPFMILLSVFALYRFYTCDKIEKEYRAKIEKFLEDYRNFRPTRYSYANIKRITNQFTEKLGEGAYETVFKEESFPTKFMLQRRS